MPHDSGVLETPSTVQPLPHLLLLPFLPLSAGTLLLHDLCPQTKHQSYSLAFEELITPSVYTPADSTVAEGSPDGQLACFRNMNLNPEQPEPLGTMATTSPHGRSSFCKQTQAKVSATGGHHRQDMGGPTVCWARHPLRVSG